MKGRYLVIPSENRTREFDAKLLAACCAVEAGYRAIVGSRHDIHLAINQLPRSTYIGKDLRVSSALMTRILTRLGHRIVAWDEEGLVYHTREHYLAARVHAPVMQACNLLFAWGKDNAEVWRSAPQYDGTPIQEVGNPRIDLLRPELRAFHQPVLDSLARRFGSYILLNSNFAGVNHIRPAADALSLSRLGSDRATAYHRAMLEHRRSLFDHFLAALPALAEAFPDTKVVVRPHPSENPAIWNELARRHSNVHVRHEGGIVPWLLGARAILHNGCTTAIEATILQRPVVSYRPVVSSLYDIPLPNALSESASDVDGLIARLRRRPADAPPASPGPTAQQLLRQHVAALDGPLSSDLVVAGIDRLAASSAARRCGGWLQGLRGSLQANRRRLRKLAPGGLTDQDDSAAYNAHRFPAISLPEVQARIARLAECLQRFNSIRVRTLTANVFELAPGR